MDKERIQQILSEVGQTDNLNSFMVGDLFKEAVRQELKNKSDVYLGENLNFDDNKTLQENLNLNLIKIKEVFGSILEMKKVNAFYYGNVYFRHFSGSEYRKAEKTIIKGNKIINFRCLHLYSGLYSVVDKLYNLIYILTEDKVLGNYCEINQYIEDNNLKEDLYNMYGEVKIKDFTFKLFKNGRLDITFKTDEQANKFFKEIERIQIKRYSLKTWRL